ncbi:MAG: hypothetical protein RIT35_715 [Pseudomonadota bacterium]|jgi:hypothetical protein
MGFMLGSKSSFEINRHESLTQAFITLLRVTLK